MEAADHVKITELGEERLANLRRLSHKFFMPTFFQSFMSEASAKGARSTALHPLQWTLFILCSSLPVLLWAKAPEWILITLVCAAGLVVLLLGFAYIYLLLKNPDALRSEQFSLSKIAMEKGLVGDNIAGLIQYDTKQDKPPVSVDSERSKS